MIENRTPEEMQALDRFAGITLAYLLPETQLGRQVAGESLLSERVRKKYAERAYNMVEAMLEARRDREMKDVD